MKKILKTCLALLIAINLTGLGVALFVQANLGSDTITVFIDGLRKVMNITLGNASRLYNFTALIIALILSRKDIGWTTIIYALTVGYCMDFYNKLLAAQSFQDMSFLIRIFMVLLAQSCFVLTYAILIKYRKGMNQLDAISYGFSRLTNLSYTIIRTGLDVILLISGWMMGGVVGIGSIISMLSTGLLVDWVVGKVFCQKA